MTTTQQIIAWAAIGLILAMILYPPWSAILGRQGEGAYIKPMGYGFIWQGPIEYMDIKTGKVRSNFFVDATRLGIQIGICVIVAGALILIAAPTKKS